MQFRSHQTGADSSPMGWSQERCLPCERNNLAPSGTPAITRRILLCALVLLGLTWGAMGTQRASATPSAAAATGGQKVGSLTCEVPGQLSQFVLHGTMPITPRAFDRSACPLKVYAPDGTPLNTQWELVAELQNWMIVEVRALVPANRWSGVQTFDVFDGETNSFGLGGFSFESLATVALPGQVVLNVLDQQGLVHSLDLSGLYPGDQLFRYGPNTLTVRRNFATAWGGLQVWFTLNADRRQVELIINWHNGGLPAQPDVYFTTATLDVPSGWSYTPLLPDPVVGSLTLVKPDLHILPQRMERSFRLILHPDDEAPLINLEGWAAGDWSRGGYMPQNIGLPDLSHTTIDLSVQKDVDYSLLASLSPTVPGDQPESPLWPAQGVRYGGMTSGTEIHHYEGVLPAVTAQPEGVLSLYVEQLRYASRQLGCIYEANGEPIRPDDYLNPDGSRPWDMYSNVFIGNTPKDSPFEFADTGPGNGVANYDPLTYAPIDNQHFVRRTKANKALTWLDNDPLARLYVQMDAVLTRMTFYEGKYGEIVPPAIPAEGLAWGRGEGWGADIMLTAYAIGTDEYRQRTANWYPAFFSALQQAQMPNGLFSAQDDGKVAEDPPYGDGTTAFYFAHRSNEQVILSLGLRSIQSVVGIKTGAELSLCAEAIWKFAWKDGTTGVLDRYPAGPIVGPRYATKAEVPVGLVDTIYADPYHVPGAFSLGTLSGANLLDMANMVTAYTGAADIFDAKAQFEAWGTSQIQNRAPALWLLQLLLP